MDSIVPHPARSTIERRRSSQQQLATVRAVIIEAIRQRDFARMQRGFEAHRTILDEQKSLVSPVPEKDT